MAADTLPTALPTALPTILQGLNPAQRGAVVSEAAPLCIVAGAGSGKTRVLTRRVAWRVREGTADPRHILVVTFTRKAAGELADRLGALGVRDHVASGTFHALAYAQLRRRWADRSERPPTLLERKVRLLAPLLPRGRNVTVQPIDVATEIEWAKAQLIGPERYEPEAARAERKSPLPASAIASLYERYEHEKRKRGLVDFEDLLLLCARALETDRAFAASQRWRFRHLFVDEFQDVNPAQFRLLQGWRGDRADLCVVGDPNQGIFSWNGADVTLLTGFPKHFPGATVLRLDDNYRSSPQILAVANAVLGQDTKLRPNRPAGSAPTVTWHPSDHDEAHAIARALRSRHPGTPWSNQAVLTRTNAQLVLFEEALRAAQVPYRVRGRGSFLDQPEIRQALIELRRQPAGTPLLSAIVDIDELLVEGGAEERRHELEALVRLAHEHAASDPEANVESFGAWLVATVRGDQPDRGANSVTLATFHAAKGLEWPVVFLAGLERGLVPIGHADSAEEWAEERRLLYVAVTRAERELHCSWAERRTFGSRTHTRTASPWLEAVEATLRALADGGDGTEWRRHLGAGRATLERASTRAGRRAKIDVGSEADPAVYQALKTWRSATARASGVPAFVIFHDTTLAAVAEAKPLDRNSLLALPGMGPVKAERYGEALLAVVAEHVSA